jgi:hypothetical protein
MPFAQESRLFFAVNSSIYTSIDSLYAPTYMLDLLEQTTHPILTQQISLKAAVTNLSSPGITWQKLVIS